METLEGWGCLQDISFSPVPQFVISWKNHPPASLPMAVSFMVLELLPPAPSDHVPVYPCKKPPHPSAVFSFSSSSSLGSFCSLELSVLHEEGGLGTGKGQGLLQQRKGKYK